MHAKLCVISSVFIVLCNVPWRLGAHISNLDSKCFRCLCYVVDCDMAHRCSDGYCGPFYLPRDYWVDAGKPIMPDDDPDRKEAFEDCARNYHCSIKIVGKYMERFGKDCNGDGVTDCYDYMMINYHGGFDCSESLSDSEEGRKRIKLYNECRL